MNATADAAIKGYDFQLIPLLVGIHPKNVSFGD